jgi:hypothetical protein
MSHDPQARARSVFDDRAYHDAVAKHLAAAKEREGGLKAEHVRDALKGAIAVPPAAI